MKVGPTKSGSYGSILWSHYPSSGETAIALIDDNTEEIILVATVNLYNPQPEPCADDEVWLKTWSENEGINKALEDCGVCYLTGEVWPAGYTIAKKARLTPAAIADRDATLSPEEKNLMRMAKKKAIEDYRQSLIKAH